MNLSKLPEPPITEEQAMSVPVKRRRNMRDSMEQVFEDMGGVDGMKSWVNESSLNKRIFYRDIVPKLVPKEVNNRHTGEDGGPVVHKFVWEGGPPDPAKNTEKEIAPTSNVIEIEASTDE